MFPPGEEESMYKRSIVRKDYTYFGPTISDKVYQSRVDDGHGIKSIHNNDSMAQTLMMRRRPMLTRTAIDYRPPCELFKLYMAQQSVSPYVRMDSLNKLR